MSGRSPARAAAARNPARVRFAFATPSARCFQSEAGSRLRQAPPTTSPVPPAPASPATSACIPTPRGVPPAHPRPPRRQPFSPTEFSRRSTAPKTHNRCAPALRARKNFHFHKSHPHSVEPAFALRRAARKVYRARSATDNMKGATLCSTTPWFIRASRFVRHSLHPHSLHRSLMTDHRSLPRPLPDSPGTQRDASGTQRD